MSRTPHLFDRRTVLAGLGASALLSPAWAASPVTVVAPHGTRHAGLLLQLMAATGVVAQQDAGWPAANDAAVTADAEIPAGWTPAGIVEMSPMIVVTREDRGVNEPSEFGDWLRAANRRIAASTSGERGAAMALADAAGAKLTGVRVSGAATQAVVEARVDLACVTAADAVAAARAGNLRAILVSGEDAIPAVWDAPSAVDAGLPLFSTSSWSGLYVRRDRAAWGERLASVQADPAVQAILIEAGHTLPPTTHRTADAHAALLASTRERYDALSRSTGMTFA